MTSTRDFTGRTEEQAELERLRAEVAEWRQRFGASELRDTAFVNSVGEVAPLYTALDVSPDSAEELGVPGIYVCARHPPKGIGGKLWSDEPLAGRKRQGHQCAVKLLLETARPDSPGFDLRR